MIKMRVTIEKVNNGFNVSVPAKDDKGVLILYAYEEFVYTTLNEVIEKVKEVYGS